MHVQTYGFARQLMYGQAGCVARIETFIRRIITHRPNFLLAAENTSYDIFCPKLRWVLKTEGYRGYEAYGAYSIPSPMPPIAMTCLLISGLPTYTKGMGVALDSCNMWTLKFWADKRRSLIPGRESRIAKLSTFQKYEAVSLPDMKAICHCLDPYLKRVPYTSNFWQDW